MSGPTPRHSTRFKNVLVQLVDKCLKLASEKNRKRLLQRLRGTLSDIARFDTGDIDMYGSLAHLRRIGFSPALIIDVGAHVGAWTRRTRAIFNSATILMIEADPIRHATLKNVCAELGGNVHFKIGLLGETPQEAVDFFSMGSGSSVLEENTPFMRSVMRLPMTTLDSVVAASSVCRSGSVLLKLDVQGYELPVLKGGGRTLESSRAVLVETSLLEYNKGGALAAELIAFMREHGFVLYDICGLARRYADNAMFQADLMFVPENDPLRAPRAFWPPSPDHNV